jgi:hypothetical protein
MKSLEIVNELVSLTKNEIKVCLSEKNTSDLLVIKQYLEVLEIIKKKKVEILHLWYIIRTNEEKDNEYILMKYNESFGNQRYELTMEELLKLKQWLEENENE